MDTLDARSCSPRWTGSSSGRRKGSPRQTLQFHDSLWHQKSQDLMSTMVLGRVTRPCHNTPFHGDNDIKRTKKCLTWKTCQYFQIVHCVFASRIVQVTAGTALGTALQTRESVLRVCHWCSSSQTPKIRKPRKNANQGLTTLSRADKLA